MYGKNVFTSTNSIEYDPTLLFFNPRTMNFPNIRDIYPVSPTVNILTLANWIDEYQKNNS